MNRKRIVKIVFACLLWTTAPTLLAESFNAANYWALEVKAREYMLSGMQQRIDLLKLDSFNDALDQHHDAFKRDQVSKLYQRHGTTSFKHLQDGTRFDREVRAYLRQNPNLAKHLLAIKAKFDVLSEEINRLEQGSND